MKGPITVGKLRELLLYCADNALVILASDPEGNSYDTAYSYNISARWVEGDMDREPWFPDDESTPPEDSVPAIVLWP